MEPGQRTRSADAAFAGPYILSKTLGEGSYGKVKLGRHVKSGDLVAVKILRKSSVTRSEKALQRVRREVAILSVINHPCVTRMVDFVQSNEHLFIVLEYVSGGDLLKCLRAHGVAGVPAPKAFRLFYQITSGLEYCHSCCICHRDIKPENILLDSEGSAKLADFGMANLMKANPGAALLETSCGSPHYAAPEVILGNKYDGTKSDVWSLGVLMFGLFAGRLPFNDANLQRLLEKVITARYDMPPRFDADLRDITERMLCVDPNTRITLAEVKTHPFWISSCERYGFDVKGQHAGELPPNNRIDTYPLDELHAAPDDGAEGGGFHGFGGPPPSAAASAASASSGSSAAGVPVTSGQGSSNHHAPHAANGASPPTQPPELTLNAGAAVAPPEGSSAPTSPLSDPQQPRRVPVQLREVELRLVSKPMVTLTNGEHPLLLVDPAKLSLADLRKTLGELQKFTKRELDDHKKNKDQIATLDDSLNGGLAPLQPEQLQLPVMGEFDKEVLDFIVETQQWAERGRFEQVLRGDKPAMEKAFYNLLLRHKHQHGSLASYMNMPIIRPETAHEQRREGFRAGRQKSDSELIHRSNSQTLPEVQQVKDELRKQKNPKGLFGKMFRKKDHHGGSSHAQQQGHGSHGGAGGGSGTTGAQDTQVRFLIRRTKQFSEPNFSSGGT